MAALTGTSRQTVTTILNEMKEQNLSYIDQKKIYHSGFDYSEVVLF